MTPQPKCYEIHECYLGQCIASLNEARELNKEEDKERVDDRLNIVLHILKSLGEK